MSKEVDQKVVEMQFDNKQFEQGVSTTMSSVEKLKKSLKFDGVSKGFNDISNAAKNVNMSGLGSAIDTVHAKFSALQVMGVTALANITNSAVNSAKRVASAFTIDPIKTGFQEYETQINAVQTILANTRSKGTTLDQVNQALDTLNTYADKTIYNFTEMTRNIGTFTAAGVDLDTSVKSIQGIANLAAVSGSNAQQASTAMYQLSQALASGTVKLTDWNSVVNAGMGGQVFQDALKETARVHGIAIDDMIKEQGSFRETLQKGWLSSEILTETLEKFTLTTEGLTDAQIQQNREMLKSKGYTDTQIDDIFKLGATATDAATKVKTFTQLMDTLKEAVQSGWSQTWEILAGDFEEAKELYTSISDAVGEIIKKSAESRNNLLEGAMTSNWDKLVKKINEAGIETSAFESKIKETAKSHNIDIEKLISDYGSLKKAFQSGAISSDILNESVNGLGKTVSELDSIKEVLGLEDAGDDIKKVQEALTKLGYNTGEIDGIFGKNTEAAVKAFQEAKGLVADGIIGTDTLNALKEATGTTEKLVENCDDLITAITDIGGRAKIIESFKNILSAIKSVIVPVKEAFREVFPPMTVEQLKSMIDGFHEFTKKLKVTDETAQKIKSTFKGLFSIIGFAVDAVKSIVKGIFSLGRSATGIVGKILNVTSAVGNYVTELRNGAKATGIFDKIVGSITGLFDKLTSAISKFMGGGIKELSPIFEGIWTSIKNVGLKIGESASSMFSGLFDAFKNGNVDRFMDILNSGIFATILLAVRKFIKNFTSEFSSNAKGITGQFKDMLGNVSEILDSVRGSVVAWQQNIKAGTLLKIASAIAILTASIVVLSTIDKDKLNSTLGAITALFIELIASVKMVSGLSGKISGAVSIVTTMFGMSIAVLILAGALKKLSELNTEEIGKGLVGVGGLMAEVVAAVKLMNIGGSKSIKGALGIVIFAAAIKILASVCKDLSTMKWDEIGKGLAAVGGLMAEVDIFVNTAKTGVKTITTALGIVILASAIKILESSVKNFANMNWEEIGKGLAGVGGLLAELAVFEKVAGGASRVMSTGLSLVLIGASMTILAGVMERMSKLSWGEIGRGLTAIAGALFAISLSSRMLDSENAFLDTGALTVAVSSLVVLAEAMERMSKLSWEEIARGVVASGASIVVLAKGLNAMRGTGKASLALIAASTALIILGGALHVVSSVGIIGAVTSLAAIAGVFGLLYVAAKGLAPLVPSILKLAGSIAALGGSFVVLGAGIFAIGTGLLSLVTSLVTAMLTLQNVKWSDMLKGLVAMASIFAVIGISASLLKPLIPTILALSGSVALLGLSCMTVAIAMTLMAAGLTTLAAAGEEGIKSIVNSLKTLIVGFFEMIPEIIPSLIESVKVLILGLVDAMAECIPELADGTLKVITAVLGSLTEYAPQIIDFLITFVISLIKGLTSRLPELLSSIGGFLKALFQEIVGLLNGLNTDNLLKGIGVVGLISGLIFVLSSIVGMIPGAMLGVIGVGALIAELALVLAAIGALNQIPGLEWLVNEGGNLLEAVGKAIGKFIGGIVGGTAEAFSSSLPEIGVNLSDFMDKVGGFVEGIKMVDGKVIAGAGFLSGAIIALTGAEIINAIGSFLSGGVSFAQLGSELSAFAVSASPFIAIASTIDPAAMEGAKTLAETLVILTAGSLLDGISNFLGLSGSIEDFAGKLVPFGEAIAGFSAAVSGKIDTDAVTAAANAGKIMAEMNSAIPSSGGLIQKLTGEKDLGKFGKNLTAFGDAIVGFSKKVSEEGAINEDAVTAAANAGKIMIAMNDALPKTGGLVQLITGEQDMAKFGENLTSFGEAIVGFSKKVSEEGAINEGAITAAANAGTLMSELQGSIESTGGVVDFFTGTRDLGDFGEQIKAFGDAMVDFSSAVTEGGINETSVKAAASAGAIMAELQKSLPEDGWFDSVVSLDDFGDDIVDFGESIAEYSDAVKDVDNGVMSRSISAARSLISIAKSVTDIDTDSINNFNVDAIGEAIANYYYSIEGLDTKVVSSSITSAKNIVSLVKSLVGIDTSGISKFKVAAIGVSMKVYYDKVSGINPGLVSSSISSAKQLVSLINSLATLDTSGVSSFISAVNSLGELQLDKVIKAFDGGVSKITNVGMNISEALIKGMNSKQSAVSMTARNIVDTVANSMSSKNSVFSTTGLKLITELASGIKKGSSNVESSTISTLSDAVNGTMLYYDRFYYAGSYLVTGFAKGISENAYKAAAKATAMAKAAVEAAESALGINSPSKVFYKIGEFTVKGFINALEYSRRQVYVAGSVLGDTAKDGLNSTINRIADFINGDIDVQPTIRPVLDLSNVEHGVDSISRIFSNGPSLGVMTNLNAINTTMNRRNQNGSNDDVISAIDRLRDALGESRGDTYNIDGVTYDDGSNVADAVQTLVRYARIGRRI